LTPPQPPEVHRRKTGRKVLLGGMALGLLAGVGTGILVLGQGSGDPYADLQWHTIGRQNLQMTIVERGALESAENADIVCRVKARTQGSTIASTVRWLIDAGTEVKQGDKLIELDDAGLQDTLNTQQITVDQARAAWIQADEAYKIGESQNASDIASAQLKLDLARIALRNYLEGDYLKTRRDIDGRLLMAASDLEMWEERASWSDRMSRPGRRYVTEAQAEADAARKKNARIALEGVKEEMRVLEDPKFGTKVQNVKKLQGDIDEAGRALERVVAQAKAKEVQLDADRKSKRSVYEQAVSAFHDIEAEIKKCVLYAPNDGLVVYFVPSQTRYGQGTQQSIVAQGEPVREGQKLMLIPNLSKMVVNAKVHEAMVNKVRGDQWQRTGFSDCVQIGLWTTPHLLDRLCSQAYFFDQRSAFAEKYKPVELRLVRPGQAATVRVDAFPSRILHGHVKTVSTVSSQADWASTDVKVYSTYVSIDEPLEGLRPDMSAEVTIFTDLHTEHALALPLQAVVGSMERGSTVRCFIRTPQGPAERAITLGLSNDLMVEVTSGLQEGDQVVLNPKALLPDKDRVAAPRVDVHQVDVPPGAKDKGQSGAGRDGKKGKAGGEGKGGRKKKAAPPEGEGQ
jgi:multidrug resistance efflux pump